MDQAINWLVKLPAVVVLGAAFLLPLLESSLFVGIVFPGETAVLIAGVVASQGALLLWGVILVASAGAISGDSFGYEIGKRYGQHLLDRLPKRLVKPEHIERTTALLRRRAGYAVFIGRFTAALRVLVPGMAGISRLPYPTFLLFNALGGVLWATAATIVGYIAGKSYHAAEQRMSIIGVGVLALIVGGYLLVRLPRHPRVAPLVDARLSTERWTGLPLTLAIAGVGGTSWLFGGITEDVAGHEELAQEDPHRHEFLVAHRLTALSHVARVVTYMGSTPVAYLAVVIAVVLVVWRNRYWAAIFAIPALLAGQLICAGVSLLVHRQRPPRAHWLTSADGYAFPSGHAGTAVLVWGLVVALAWPWLRDRRYRAIAMVAAGLIAVVCGATRAYLGTNWPTDVVGGWTLGGLLLTLAVVGLALLRFPFVPKWQSHRPSREVNAVGDVD
ncbi:bifunctional DedA family/phosphatase PAP2 family protein [Mycobacterium kyorinense]|uniref:bifunctional DedA family/phosphatase PAP2 family protein n=1 Tax=Mycobacterium kyorinense TaxID=487514 RepID=UPI00084BF60C|nr:bifunctional DedA family/phosphatase PAP2 family protein [Mycobacterium kyorinense]